MQNKIEKIRQWAEQNNNELIALYGFGSYFEGMSNSESDIDLAWLGKEKLADLERWKMQEELASLLGKNVDLIDLKSTTTVFRFEIISHAQLIFCSNSDTAAFFETYVYSSYLRFQEERKAILSDVLKRGSVYGG
ncbi:MAG: nucleotidyltransferase domain-containing protein [Deltaproteobacteria bacterium]|nr:nucleotidyltransferase domain-containing protein [Deltaproteobacteria bacterium]